MPTADRIPAMPIYSIGHSNHDLATFVELLRRHRIEVVADVRSVPMSRRFPQFNGPSLARTLISDGATYLDLGKELGARRSEKECYVHGRVSFERVWELPAFQSGIERLLRESSQARLAMLCAERDPMDCHRSMMIARYLRRLSLDVQHILSDGALESHAGLEDRLLAQHARDQEDLFRGREERLEEAYALQARRIAYARPAGKRASAQGESLD